MRFEPEEGTWTQRERVALCSAVGLGSEAMAVPKAPSPGWAPRGRQRSQQPLNQEGAVWSKRVGGGKQARSSLDTLTCPGHSAICSFF